MDSCFRRNDNLLNTGPFHGYGIDSPFPEQAVEGAPEDMRVTVQARLCFQALQH